ncbi:MAG TPA: hypothetical protein VN258_15630 [Mobilitalea sp.]|nr:hypothetical protein [Mobilitalea sp.]
MKIEHSEEAKYAADEFMNALKNGTLSKHVLPNNYEDYTLEFENIDYRSYQRYLKTMSYFNYVENRTVAYNGQL